MKISKDIVINETIEYLINHFTNKNIPISISFKQDVRTINVNISQDLDMSKPEFKRIYNELKNLVLNHDIKKTTLVLKTETLTKKFAILS